MSLWRMASSRLRFAHTMTADNGIGFGESRSQDTFDDFVEFLLAAYEHVQARNRVRKKIGIRHVQFALVNSLFVQSLRRYRIRTPIGISNASSCRTSR